MSRTKDAEKSPRTLGCMLRILDSKVCVCQVYKAIYPHLVQTLMHKTSQQETISNFSMDSQRAMHILKSKKYYY